MKRYFIGVMLPAKSFAEELDALLTLAAKYNLENIICDLGSRMVMTKRVTVWYVNNTCTLDKLRGRRFDAVFHFDNRYRAILDVRVTEIRDDNYLDYILEKEGVVNHGRGM